jgi:hypothetical protein
MLDLTWVFRVIENFRAVQASAIQVYPVDADVDFKYQAHGKRGLFASWDGQHTLAAFYIIAVLILKQNPKDVMVPVNIYKISKKAEIRENFVSGNSEIGKKLLDTIDLFMQMIYGVRLDGSTNPVWREAELKQQYLEQADLFVTADKFGDTHMPGAISRMQEIDHYNSEIIRKFCLYAATVMPAGRHRHQDYPHRGQHPQHDRLEGHLGGSRPEHLPRPRQDPADGARRAQLHAM